jgi:hypothetical protein
MSEKSRFPSPMKMFRPLFLSPDRERRPPQRYSADMYDDSGYIRRDVGISINTIIEGTTKSSNNSKAIIQQDYMALNLEPWNYPGKYIIFALKRQLDCSYKHYTYRLGKFYRNQDLG